MISKYITIFNRLRVYDYNTCNQTYNRYRDSLGGHSFPISVVHNGTDSYKRKIEKKKINKLFDFTHINKDKIYAIMCGCNFKKYRGNYCYKFFLAEVTFQKGGPKRVHVTPLKEYRYILKSVTITPAGINKKNKFYYFKDCIINT